MDWIKRQLWTWRWKFRNQNTLHIIQSNEVEIFHNKLCCCKRNDLVVAMDIVWSEACSLWSMRIISGKKNKIIIRRYSNEFFRHTKKNFSISISCICHSLYLEIYRYGYMEYSCKFSMNFPLIYITIIRLGLLCQRTLYNTILIHRRATLTSSTNSQKMERKKTNTETTKYGHNERMVCELYISRARERFFSLPHRCASEKKHYCSCGGLDATSVSICGSNFISFDPIWKAMEIFASESARARGPVMLSDHAQFLVVTCKCINELGAFRCEWSACE